MKGLSDVHLFNKWGLNGNPISMRISDTLEASLKDKPFSFRPSSESQCGTFSMKLDKTQWENVVNTLNQEFEFMDKQRTKAADLSKEINRYLEQKCEKYCKDNRISFIDWSHLAYSERRRNTWEVRYNGELVCGAKVICETVDTDALEANVKLELY